jgi:hypothetical protein
VFSRKEIHKKLDLKEFAHIFNSRHLALCQIIDALTPLGAKMPEGEPIGIRVQWKINIALGSNGVRREENEDIPL